MDVEYCVAFHELQLIKSIYIDIVDYKSMANNALYQTRTSVED
jgi:hypothetical protein